MTPAVLLGVANIWHKESYGGSGPNCSLLYISGNEWLEMYFPFWPGQRLVCVVETWRDKSISTGRLRPCSKMRVADPEVAAGLVEKAADLKEQAERPRGDAGDEAPDAAGG